MKSSLDSCCEVLGCYFRAEKKIYPLQELVKINGVNFIVEESLRNIRAEYFVEDEGHGRICSHNGWSNYGYGTGVFFKQEI